MSGGWRSGFGTKERRFFADASRTRRPKDSLGLSFSFGDFEGSLRDGM